MKFYLSATMLAVALLCAACAQPPGYWCRSAIFNFTEKRFYIGAIPSEEPGILALRTGLYTDTQGQSFSLATRFALEQGAAKAQDKTAVTGGKSPVLLMQDDKLLMRDYVGDHSTGIVELTSGDILKPKLQVLGHFNNPPRTWTLPLFMHDGKQLHMLYPQGDKLVGEKLSSIALDGAPKQPSCELKDIAVQGYGFIDGQRRLVCVTTASQAWRYDPASRSFQRAAELDWLGQMLKLPITSTQKRTRSFAFAQDIAGYVSKEAVVMFDPQGRERRIPVRDVLETNPNGSKRPEGIIHAAIEDPLPLVGERFVVGDKSVGRSHILPFDDKNVALFDEDYQRFLLFSAR